MAKSKTKNQLKTRPTGAGVRAFVDSIEDPARRKDCKALAKLMARITGRRGRMWGPSIVGYGTYSYENASGDAEWFLTGFAPRKRDLTLYIMSGFSGHTSLMKKLGKHKTGRSCLYVKTLADIDLEVLEQLLRRSVETLERKASD